MPSDEIVPLEAFVLRQWLLEKVAMAVKKGAARFETSYTFFLAGRGGSAEVDVSLQPRKREVNRDSDMLLTLHMPSFSKDVVRLTLRVDRVSITVGGREKKTLDSLSLISQLVMTMEVAPYPKVPYGLLDSNSLVGLVFFDGLEPGSEFSSTGYRLHIYLCRNVGVIFPFILEPDLALRLRGFWESRALGGKRRIQAKVILLTKFLGMKAIRFENSGVQDGRSWIDLGFYRLDRLTGEYHSRYPGWRRTDRTRYWAWDAERRRQAAVTSSPHGLKEIFGPKRS